MRLLRWLLWITGLFVTILGAAICMQPESPETGVFVVLAGLVISSIVDGMDENFDLLRVGIRGVAMFASLAVILLWRQAHQ